MGRYPLRTAIGEYVEAHRSYLAEATIAERRRKLLSFADRYQSLCRNSPDLERNPARWGEKEITAILLDVKRRGWSLATQAKELENLQALLRFLGNGVVEKMRSNRPQLFPRRTTTRGPSISEEQLTKVLTAASKVDGWTGEVARFIVTAYAFTGLRPGELRKAEIGDLDVRTWSLRVRHPKGEARYGEHRIVPIPSPMRNAVLDYLRAREAMLTAKGLLEAKPLVCRSSDPTAFYSPMHLRRIKKKVEEISGVAFELRALRRTYGQNLLNRGVPLETVSLALGHSSTLTTERYYCRKDADTARLEILRAFERSAPGPSVNSPLIERKGDLTGYV
jgi:integrase